MYSTSQQRPLSAPLQSTKKMRATVIGPAQKSEGLDAWRPPFCNRLREVPPNAEKTAPL
jgi:hypothetical protein